VLLKYRELAASTPRGLRADAAGAPLLAMDSVEFLFVNADNTPNLADFSDAIRGFAAVHATVETGIKNGELPPACARCRPCKARTTRTPMMKQALALCQESRKALLDVKLVAVIEALVKIGHRAVERSVAAWRNVTALTRSSVDAHLMGKWLAAAHKSGAQQLVVQQAGTVEREAPSYAFEDVPGSTVRFQSIAPLGNALDVSVDPSGEVARLFTDMAASRLVSRGVRLQWNAPCTCTSRTIPGSIVVAAVRAYVASRTTLSPVCRCPDRVARSVKDRVWASFASENLHDYT